MLDTAARRREIRAMQIETIVVGPYEVNCYITGIGGGTEAVVIDPGADADALLQHLRAARLKPVAYLLTHGHADHIGGLAQLLADYPAPVYLHAADQAWAFSPRNAILPYYPPTATPAELRTVSEDKALTLAGITFRVIATPGHTPGGVCYYVEQAQALFTGDTLFQGTVGRTDLPGGDGRVLAQSLKKLAVLPSATHIYPGHGADSTLAAEQRTNIYFRAPASL